MSELYEPHSYKVATEAERNAVCNGCGSSQAKFDFVPDTIYLLNINECCQVHDWMYAKGKTLKDKQNADSAFLHNMLCLIDERGGWLKRLRRCRAWEYYKMVEKFGAPAFWAGK